MRKAAPSVPAVAGVMVPDPVSAMLAEIRVAAASIGSFAFGPPWSIHMHGAPSLFLLTAGHCWLRDADGALTRLSAGDSVLAIHGDSIHLSSRPDCTAYDSIERIWEARGGRPVSFQGYRVPVDISWGDGPVDCRMIGAAITLSRFTTSATTIRGLPALIVQRGEESGVGPWVTALQAMLKDEPREGAPGYLAIGASTVHLLLMQLLRTFLAGDGVTPPAELREKHGRSGLAQVIRALHLDPSRPWTIDMLARHAGMSRSSFIARFSALTGMPPHHYLSACRMERAAQALATDTQSISEIAALSGYQSERAFRAIFQRTYGLAPLAYRKRHKPG